MFSIVCCYLKFMLYLRALDNTLTIQPLMKFGAEEFPSLPTRPSISVKMTYSELNLFAS